MLPPALDPLKNPGMQQRTPVFTTDMLQLADHCTENLSLSPEEVTSESMISSCSDLGYRSRDDDCHCPAEFEHFAQTSTTSEIRTEEEIYIKITNDTTDEYDLNAMLCQFETFFRRKLNSELETFQECMHAMLSEQQTHIQRIINSASIPPAKEVTRNMSSPCITLADQSMPSDASGQNGDKKLESSCVCVNSENKAKTNVIMELLALSCQLSALLNMPKFS